MSYLWIQGGNKLEGKLPVSGAKNSVLPLLAASVLFREECVIHNIPDLTDVQAAVEILRSLGCTVRMQGSTAWIRAGGLGQTSLPKEWMGAMRSSILFLGPVLARLGRCSFCMPGGCSLGSRPIDMHLDGLKTMGARIIWDWDCLTACGKLKGNKLVLPYPSVGATENLILAALGAEGTTVIYNAAREPEIGDLIGFLTLGGARIYGRGTSMLQIEGGLPDGVEYTVMPDRMEAATFLAAAAATGGELCLSGARADHLEAVLQVLEASGCRLWCEPEAICLKGPDRLQSPGVIRTAPYPGFPTDAQAPLMAALTRAVGVTVFDETVFSHRYRHVPALRKLGADIRTAGTVASVCGVPELHGAYMTATDLRGGAAMAVGALAAQGESRIDGLSHIFRGYGSFHTRLRVLGAGVKIVEDEPADTCQGGIYNGLGTEGTEADGPEKAAPASEFQRFTPPNGGEPATP